jgi:hypothetical protein
MSPLPKTPEYQAHIAKHGKVENMKAVHFRELCAIMGVQLLA